MHLSRLPQRIKEEITPDLWGVFLKKIRELYCPRMTHIDACPMECWRCTKNLNAMLDEYDGGGAGQWHGIVQSHTTTLVEKIVEKRRERKPRIIRDTPNDPVAALLTQQQDSLEASGVREKVEEGGTGTRITYGGFADPPPWA